MVNKIKDILELKSYHCHKNCMKEKYLIILKLKHDLKKKCRIKPDLKNCFSIIDIANKFEKFEINKTFKVIINKE